MNDELIEERNAWRNAAMELSIYARHIAYEDYPDSSFGDEAKDDYRWFCELLRHYGDGKDDWTRDDYRAYLELRIYTGREILEMPDHKEQARETLRALWRIFDQRKADNG